MYKRQALGCAIQAAWFFPQIAHGNVLRQEIEWLPVLGLNLVFRMDGFAWLFCMLVLGIGALVVLYARYYMSASDPVPRFFSFFLAFMGAMMGVVLSGNLIQMVLFWELTSLFSFLLIGYWPVSYTHLDVYKRQALPRLPGVGQLSTPPRGRTLTTIQNNGHPEAIAAPGRQRPAP